MPSKEYNISVALCTDNEQTRAELGSAMQRVGLLEDPIPKAAQRWIVTFLEAYGPALDDIPAALVEIAALRAEATTVPAIALERLRTRQVLFFLDAVAQYVDS